MKMNMNMNNVNKSKTKRVLVLAKYPNSEDMFLTNLDYEVYNKVFKSKLINLTYLYLNN